MSEVILPAGWVKDAEWSGNPELGFESYTKVFKPGPHKRGGNRGGTVTVYGCATPIESSWKGHPYLGFTFVVKRSHSGRIGTGSIVDVLKVIQGVEDLYTQGILFW